MRFIFALDHQHPVSPRTLQKALGLKGANLAHMTADLGLRVPPGFTLSTRSGRESLGVGDFRAGLRAELSDSLRLLGEQVGETLGDPERPLFLSMRAGVEFPLPSEMPTVLYVGLNDGTVAGLARLIGDLNVAYQHYGRLIQAYGTLVLSVPAGTFGESEKRVLASQDVGRVADLPLEGQIGLVQQLKDVILAHSGIGFPQDPVQQLEGLILAAFGRWDDPACVAYRSARRIPHDGGVALTVQRMVTAQPRAVGHESGVALSHDPQTGQRGLCGEAAAIADGGYPLPVPPAIRDELQVVVDALEESFRDMVKVDFVVDNDGLWILGAGSARRSGTAAVRVAVELTKKADIGLSTEEAVCLVSGNHLEQILHPQFAQADRQQAITVGIGVSPGAAVGHVYFSTLRAMEADDRGESVVLVKDETSPLDEHGMKIAAGILTSKGGLTSHAAVVARSWGKPAICGATGISIGDGYFTAGSVRVNEGETISIDGASGAVYLGALSHTDAASGPGQAVGLEEAVGTEQNVDLEQILAWADTIRAGRLGVRANADTAPEAELARSFGAEGIGLCRTEHQFLGEHRPLIEALILATTVEEEAAALQQMATVQEEVLFHLFQAMDGLPVTVRLLDPPLHEFLPQVDPLAPSQSGRRLLEAAQEWHEENPMLGTRGVRLGILRPSLYRMQARAIMAAGLRHSRAGGSIQVEIMVPLIINRAELDLVSGWIEEEVERANAGVEQPLDVLIGAMIETPRAALSAGDIASGTDFFSFGTNDLTQMTLGFSRDDIEHRILGEYLERSILSANPFQTLDLPGVGRLVSGAAGEARSSHPGIKLGVCGEHAGDPASIRFFQECGMDYVSCSPYRVPIARLAAAQAIATAKVGHTKDRSH